MATIKHNRYFKPTKKEAIENIIAFTEAFQHSDFTIFKSSLTAIEVGQDFNKWFNDFYKASVDKLKPNDKK